MEANVELSVFIICCSNDGLLGYNLCEYAHNIVVIAIGLLPS